MENHSVGDVTDGKDHTLPVYLENYFKGKIDKEQDLRSKERRDKEQGDTSAKAENRSDNDGNKVSLARNEGYLEVHFIDVGQGDASLIRFVDTNLANGDDSAAMLVDAGDAGKGTTVRNYLEKQGVESLQYFVCTHPDADHIGGAASVVSQVPILSEIVWGPNYQKSTKTYENLQNEIFYKSYSYEEPSYGKEYSLGLATFVFVAPLESHEDVNSNSLVFKIWYGDDSFLFVGDCDLEEEAEISNSAYSKFVDSDVLKVGHHGSGTSSGKEFLSLVSPVYAVLSVGEGNPYHHPHKSALDQLNESGTKLYRTDKQGSIVANASGSGISFNIEPTNDWTPGE